MILEISSFLFFLGGDTYTLTNCTTTNDTVCSICEQHLIWSEDLAQCVQCGPCCSNSVVDLSCSLKGSDPGANCLFNPDCIGVKMDEQLGGGAKGKHFLLSFCFC